MERPGGTSGSNLDLLGSLSVRLEMVTSGGSEEHGGCTQRALIHLAGWYT